MMTQKTASGAGRTEKALLYYRLTSEEWLRACRELKPSEKDVLYYLRTLDPFGERDLDIGVRQMGRDLGMSASTVSRALKTLDSKGWIDMEITSARVKLHSQQPVEDGVTPTHPDQSCGKVLPPRNTVASAQQAACGKVLPTDNSVVSTQQVLPPRNDLDRHATLGADLGLPVENVYPLQGEDFSDSEFSTECTRSVLNTLKQEQNGTEYSEPVENGAAHPEPIRKTIGTLLGEIEAAGVEINGTLEQTLAQVFQVNPGKAPERVRNAISSLQEQSNVRNPQAFLNAALKRGFTSNEAKQKVSRKSQNKSEGTKVPPPPNSVDLSDWLVAVDIECRRLGLSHDQAVTRLGQTFGWESRTFDDLTTEEDLVLLHTALCGWS